MESTLKPGRITEGIRRSHNSRRKRRKARARTRTSPERSAMMAAVRSSGTAPELRVREMLTTAGYPFTVDDRTLPGRPDIVITSCRIAVFVHGCFWHLHRGCARAKLPKQNSVFWKEKLTANVKRDRRVLERLRQLGWQAVVIWQCRVEQGLHRLLKRLDSICGDPARA